MEAGAWRRVPEVATPRAVGSAIGVFFACGGLAALAVTAGMDLGAPVVRAVVAAVGLLAVVVGAAVWRVRADFPVRATHPLVLAGVALITVTVLVAPTGTDALALAAVYTFLAVDAFVFFAPLTALAHLAVCVVAATAAVTAHDELSVTHAVALDVVLVAIAVVVGVLARKASRASVDALTGLPNRRGVDQALERLARAAERSGGTLAVALLDLDHFKEVNDGGGHAAGDALLRETAARWRRLLPEAAVLGRTGGDEFAVVLPGAPTAELALLLAALVRDERSPASAGIALWSPPESPWDAVRRADGALYRAKRAGRGRCETAVVDPLEESMAEDLLVAVRTGGLEVHYQPVVAAEDGRLVGVEALARWTHPVRGRVGPDVFVAVAERHGFVGELGTAVLQQACRELAALPGAVDAGVSLAVNVSGLELVEGGYVRRLGEVLRGTGWPAHLLVLEVTESVVEGDAARALSTLADARALGVRVAVDDFGTGYSALSRLDHLRAAYLKLDATFTATVHTSERRTQLVRAVTALSRTLGLGVVAEGVETPAQARLLADLGCDYLQGYHLGRPEPVSALAARLAGTGAPRVPDQRAGTAAATAGSSAAPAEV